MFIVFLCELKRSVVFLGFAFSGPLIKLQFYVVFCHFMMWVMGKISSCTGKMWFLKLLKIKTMSFSNIDAILKLL